MEKVHGKTIARQHVIQILYCYEMTNSFPPNINDPLAVEVAKNVLEHKSQTDELIRKHLKKWAFSEMNKVNVAILNLAIYEMQFTTTPNAVVVNEALNLAKKYSDLPSKNFIHHILDKVSNEQK